MALTKLTTDLIDGSLGTDWQATPKTASFTAVAGEGYFVDTTSTAITVTLPSSPAQGDRVRFFLVSGSNFTVARNGKLINGDSSNLTVTTEDAAFEMVFHNNTYGWRIFTI